MQYDVGDYYLFLGISAKPHAIDSHITEISRGPNLFNVFKSLHEL